MTCNFLFYIFILLTFLLPLERLGSFEFWGITIRFSQLILLVILALLPFCIPFSKIKNLYFSNKKLYFSLILFITIAAFSIIQSINVARSLFIFFATLFTASLAFVIPLVIDTEAKLRQTIGALFITTTLACLFGLYQFTADMLGAPTSWTGLLPRYAHEILGFSRIQSTFAEPLYFANFLFLPFFLALAYFLNQPRHPREPGGLIGDPDPQLLKKNTSPFTDPHLLMGLLLTSLLLTTSRGAYLGLLAGCAFFLIFAYRKIFSKHYFFSLFKIGLASIILSFSLLQIGSSTQTKSFFEHTQIPTDSGSFLERKETFTKAWQLFLQKPLLGHGIGSFGPHLSADPQIPPAGGFKIVNNQYLELMAEVGILGIVPITVFFILLITQAISLLKTQTQISSHSPLNPSTNDRRRLLLLGLTSAIIAILAQYMTLSTLYMMQMWFAIGLLIAAIRILSSKTNVLG
ncbi:MAG: Lipid A core--O-antigen ligase-like protein [Parcubacteria group bacterium Gr01-1014_18]|nr:MAG: Lipid A core--O-antigen ligase-like protein [Parcubacteria group bacterium Greene0416_36]TSC81187.1 MAG: Lipid A core--O-antigen ligase-like protein [Parcubacteria group bacterium Gr01-1014_18]TSC99184.1 MAG: Lipid A core--O-antigen ligase-like protein [Parcubacteria group bacterium Greene1014_20]TSD07458.1 MAG: Lipid A core--O-antigen ligase-like protein [Parcubacteria group bacterium Greene0714_2]